MNTPFHNWVLLELGGSSSQSVVWDASSNDWSFQSGILRDPERKTALACPGLIRGKQVWYASNLGWPEQADPSHELGIEQIEIVTNDASAAALGEAYLRNPNQLPELYFIGLGSGVGSAAVVNGAIVEWNLGHAQIGGDASCAGCRAHGCLNAYLEARALPKPIDGQTLQFIAETLAQGMVVAGSDPERLVVLAGGISRQYPELAERLAKLIPNSVEASKAPAAAKSAAYAGLAYLVHQQS
jgi:predicted NBD/HSP70 family sugar kinase